MSDKKKEQQRKVDADAARVIELHVGCEINIPRMVYDEEAGTTSATEYSTKPDYSTKTDYRHGMVGIVVDMDDDYIYLMAVSFNGKPCEPQAPRPFPISSLTHCIILKTADDLLRIAKEKSSQTGDSAV